MIRRHGLAGFMRAMGALPVTWVTAFGGALGWLLGVAPLRLASPRRFVLINLLVCYPELSWRECKRMGRRSLMETGRTLAEFTTIWAQPVEHSLARISHVRGRDQLRAAIASPRPLLLLSLHLSSWELVNLLLGREGPAVVMYKPDNNPDVTELVRQGRERTGCRLVPATNAGVKVALEAMRAGGTVAILADHHPAGGNNPFAPFFGHPVHTPGLISKLVLRHRPHVFFTSCYRRNGPRDVHVIFEQAPAVESGETDAAVLTAMNKGLETSINRAPEQYHWPYKRFRAGPGGVRNWYRHSRRILARARKDADRQRLGLVSR
jgi:KDO2-lipid IV(A) lauroyltransferase